MKRFGFNLNMKNTPEEILELGERYLKTGLYEAVEVTYYEDMEDTDTFYYNQAIRRIVETYHPQVTVHLSGFNLSEENSVLRNAIFREIENCYHYTKQLSGHEVIIHAGQISAGMHVPIRHDDGTRATQEEQYEKAFGLTVKLLRRACKLAEEFGITVYTENLNGSHITTDCRQLNRLIDEVGCGNLKIVFDVGHAGHMGKDITENVREAGERLKHLHIHDNFGEKDDHLPVGSGSLDFKAFTGALDEVGYDGLYMMELFHCDTENLKTSRDHLLKAMGTK